jgi:hypothetical protein
MKSCNYFKPKHRDPDKCDEAVYLEGIYPRYLLCTSDKLSYWFCPFQNNYTEALKLIGG